MHQAGRAVSTRKGSVSDLRHWFCVFFPELLEISYLYSAKWQPALRNHRPSDCLRHTAQHGAVSCALVSGHKGHNVLRIAIDIFASYSLGGRSYKVPVFEHPSQVSPSEKWKFPQKLFTRLLFPCVIVRPDRWKNSSGLSECLRKIRYDVL